MIMYYIDKAYNPELAGMKLQSQICYQEWLRLRNTDKKAAEAVRTGYAELTRKIEEMKMPFIPNGLTRYKQSSFLKCRLKNMACISGLSYP